MFREKFTEDLTERLFSDIIDITETLMKNEKETEARDHFMTRAKSQTVHEKLAANHGEGTRPVRTSFRLRMAPHLCENSSAELSSLSLRTGWPRLGLLKRTLNCSQHKLCR